MFAFYSLNSINKSKWIIKQNKSSDIDYYFYGQYLKRIIISEMKFYIYWILC